MPPKKVTPRGVKASTGPKVSGTPVQKPKRAPARTAKKRDTLYARNLHHISARVPLDTGREINLAPRGQRGDLVPVNREEQEDAKLLGNVGLVIELITPAEAEEVMSKQTIHQQVPHPTLDQLRDELGRPYKRVVTEEPFEQQGKVVARIEEEGSQRSQESRKAIIRDSSPEIVSVPGSPGTLPDIPQDVAPEQVADWAARNLDDGGLSRLRLRIEEVQKDQ